MISLKDAVLLMAKTISCKSILIYTGAASAASVCAIAGVVTLSSLARYNGEQDAEHRFEQASLHTTDATTTRLSAPEEGHYKTAMALAKSKRAGPASARLAPAENASLSNRLSTDDRADAFNLFESDSSPTTRQPVAEPTPPTQAPINAPLVSVNAAASGGGGDATLGGVSGGGGGSAGEGNTGTGGVAGSPPGLLGPTLDDPQLLNPDPLDELVAESLAAGDQSTDNVASSGAPKPDLITHPEAFSEIELAALINDIKSGAWTIAPDGRLDETARLKNAFDSGGDIVLSAGNWPTKPVQITVDGTRVVIEDGAVLTMLKNSSQTHVLQIDADDCVVIGLTANGGGESMPRFDGRHATVRINGDNNRLINCTTRGSGRLGNKQWGRQSGFAIYGDQNLLENCVSHDAAYAGIFNFGDDNYFRGCKSYNHFYKGFNQGDNGRDLQRVTVNDWYCESNRGNGSIDFQNGGVYPNGLQLDTGERQLDEAILTNIRIGPHPDGVGGIKLATIDKVTINGLYVEDSDDFNRASLVLAEGLGTVKITDGVLRRGVTQYPATGTDKPYVQRLEITNVTLGGDKLINRASLHDHLLVKDLTYRDCTFKGVGLVVFKAETPNDAIGSWIIEGCTFISGMGKDKQSQIMYPVQEKHPPFELKTLNQSGKLRFLNNTMQAPEGAEFLLSTKPFFAQLLKTVNSDGTRYHFDELPSDPRIRWQSGDTAQIGNQPGDWVCIESGRPGLWVAGAWD